VSPALAGAEARRGDAGFTVTSAASLAPAVLWRRRMGPSCLAPRAARPVRLPVAAGSA
jgi:hypothetical protein